MNGTKRKISVTLDADLLAELRRGPGSVSAQLNEAMRTELAARRRRAALQRVLDELDATDGPLDTPQDMAEMARLEQVWRDLDAQASAQVSAQRPAS